MTEQTPEAPASTPPTPAEPTPTAPKATADTAKKYAAYDKTYLRFVDGVFDTRKAASDAAKAAKVKRFEIREV